MINETEIIRIGNRGTIKLPAMIKANPGDKLYFRKDFYDEEKIIIIDLENLQKIATVLENLRIEKKINIMQYSEISRFIFSHMFDSTIRDGRNVKIPINTEYKEFECEEVHTKIKKFVLTPKKKINQA